MNSEQCAFYCGVLADKNLMIKHDSRLFMYRGAAVKRCQKLKHNNPDENWHVIAVSKWVLAR